MHAPITHILPFAALPGMGDFFQATGEHLPLPHLRQLLHRMQPVHWLRAPEADQPMNCLAAHERAWLHVCWPAPYTGHPALAALLAQQQGHAVQPGDGWAQVTPCHIHIATDSITLSDPAQLHLEPAHQEALRQSLHTLWAQDGLELLPGPAGTWLARADWLHGLALPSIDRVGLQDVRLFTPALTGAGLLQRAQTEAQMLLYEHPVNDARTAQRLLPINALWFSGTGIPPVSPTGVLTAPVHTVQWQNALREPAWRGDFYGWAQQWRTLDATWVAQLQQQLEQPGHPPLQLILAGPEHAVVLGPVAPGWAPRLRQWWQARRGRDTPSALLQRL